MGLVLEVLSDYLENGEKALERDIVTLMFATRALEAKHTVDDVSWFDSYEIIVADADAFSCVSQDEGSVDVDDPPSGIRQAVSREPTCLHERKFFDGLDRLLEVITSDEAETLMEEDPIPTWILVSLTISRTRLVPNLGLSTAKLKYLTIRAEWKQV